MPQKDSHGPAASPGEQSCLKGTHSSNLIKPNPSFLPGVTLTVPITDARHTTRKVSQQKSSLPFSWRRCHRMFKGSCFSNMLPSTAELNTQTRCFLISAYSYLITFGYCWCRFSLSSSPRRQQGWRDGLTTHYNKQLSQEEIQKEEESQL